MKIIVLTPVKNEAWILDLFLSITSQFADHIIIADQNSTDGSLDIYPKYHKVNVIQNLATEFNESERQQLLINHARKMYGEGNLLLGLDADEILEAQSLKSTEWNILKDLPKGTVIGFEKPDLYENINQCIRYNNEYPMGFIDDGSPHQASLIHSIRIPTPKNTTRYFCKEIKFIHFGLANMRRQMAKVRFYSVVEAAKGTKNALLRRHIYNPKKEAKYREKTMLIEDVPQEWLSHITTEQIEHTLSNKEKLWYNKEILHYINQYGCRLFWADRIWDIDWEKEKKNYGYHQLVITPPPLPYIKLLDFFILIKLIVKRILKYLR